jgi:hypothetical protein
MTGVILNDCGNPRDVSRDFLELNIKKITIPSIEIPSQKVHYMGGSRGESSKKLEEFPDVTVSIKMDGDLINYYTLYKWMSLLVDKEGNVSHLSKEDYATHYTVLILDQYETPIGSFVYHNMFPVQIGALDLDTANASAIVVDFTFSYDYISFDFLNESTN